MQPSAAERRECIGVFTRTIAENDRPSTPLSAKFAAKVYEWLSTMSVRTALMILPGDMKKKGVLMVVVMEAVC